ncbi:hypothetical protein N499_0923A, partial [Wolbachia pipientis wVitA]|jgi:hypothetical protein
MLEV